jgi:C4-type Zn-finger protein
MQTWICRRCGFRSSGAHHAASHALVCMFVAGEWKELRMEVERS